MVSGRVGRWAAGVATHAHGRGRCKKNKHGGKRVWRLGPGGGAGEVGRVGTSQRAELGGGPLLGQLRADGRVVLLDSEAEAGMSIYE